MAKKGKLEFENDQEVIAYASRAVLESALNRPVKFPDPDAVKQYLKFHKSQLDHEEFTVLFLDARMRLIASEDMFIGTTSSVKVEFREVVRRVLFHNAAAIVVSHNHPSCDAEPSDADIQMTMNLGKLLKMIDVDLLDHFVVGEAGEIVSVLDFIKTKMKEKIKEAAKSLPKELKDLLSKIGEIDGVTITDGDGNEIDDGDRKRLPKGLLDLLDGIGKKGDKPH